MLNKFDQALSFLIASFSLSASAFFEFDLALGSSLETTDQLLQIFVLVEVGSEGSSQIVELSLIFLSNFGQSNHCGVLLVN